MISHIDYDIICGIIKDVKFNSKVGEVEKELKTKICPENANFKMHDHAFLTHLPREELHQFLIGTYEEYVIPTSLNCIENELRKPEFIRSSDSRGIQKNLVSNEMLKGVWARLRGSVYLRDGDRRFHMDD
jgi:hypothetical protein